MKRFACLFLALILLLGVLPVNVFAAEQEVEDPVLEYGTFAPEDAPAVGLMASGSEKLYEMADIPAGGSYQTMYASQKITDVIKDFEGFRSTPYWDNTQWTVGYGTRASGPDDYVTVDEAERRLKNALDNTYGPIVNSFCKSNGKQPTQQQFDAMLDLTYNNGGAWASGESVPDVVLNPSTAIEVVRGFGAWSRSADRVSYVHVNRRIRESLMYLYGEYYRAYGGQDCKSDVEVIYNDDLPHFKTVIFKTNYGALENGRSDYAGYYPVGDYYRSFINATREGYTLVGWEITKRSNESVSDGERISIYDKVEENLELTAVWEKGNVTVDPGEPPEDFEDPFEPDVPTEPTEPTEPEMETMPDVNIDMDRLPFTDVPENSWFRDPVVYVYRNKIMNGTSASTFSPDVAMNRGMLVTVLYRMDGSVPVTDEERACFEDIANAYYTDAVAWAYANGIVNGVSETSFAPNQIITRQDAVTIFYRYCVDKGLMGMENSNDLTGFVDHDQVASYSRDAFIWAVSTGLITGSEGADGIYLNPGQVLNRAQAAALLQRCLEKIL